MLERVKLGNTGLDVNRICLGGGSFGGSTAPELVINQLDYFRSLGGIFLDTALVYCDWLKIERSSSEKLIGKWFRERGCRHEFTLSAKGCHAKIITPTGNMLTCPKTEPQLHRADIIADIEESLGYLQTDYIDIFTLHNDNETVEVGEILETLEEQKKRGVIRAYGCSNWRVVRQREAYDYAKAHGLSGFITDQISWCLNVFAEGANGLRSDAYMDDRAYAFHQETQIPVMAYAANGRAYFHRLANGMEVPEHEHREYDCPTNQALLEVLKEAARETGAEVNTIVIKYLLLEHGFQVIPTVGIKTPRELDICLAALHYDLPQEYEDRIRALRPLG